MTHQLQSRIVKQCLVTLIRVNILFIIIIIIIIITIITTLLLLLLILHIYIYYKLIFNKNHLDYYPATKMRRGSYHGPSAYTEQA
jgi:hypothetical protein